MLRDALDNLVTALRTGHVKICSPITKPSRVVSKKHVDLQVSSSRGRGQLYLIHTERACSLELFRYA